MNNVTEVSYVSMQISFIDMNIERAVVQKHGVRFRSAIWI